MKELADMLFPNVEIKAKYDEIVQMYFLDKIDKNLAPYYSQENDFQELLNVPYRFSMFEDRT